MVSLYSSFGLIGRLTIPLLPLHPFKLKPKSCLSSANGLDLLPSAFGKTRIPKACLKLSPMAGDCSSYSSEECFLSEASLANGLPGRQTRTSWLACDLYCVCHASPLSLYEMMEVSNEMVSCGRVLPYFKSCRRWHIY